MRPRSGRSKTIGFGADAMSCLLRVVPPCCPERTIFRRQARAGRMAKEVSVGPSFVAITFPTARHLDENALPWAWPWVETTSARRGRIIGTMHQLLLLRHAKSSWSTEGAADRDRTL